MPTYDYRCGTCGPFEVRRSLTEQTRVNGVTCPHCAAVARRVFGAPALRGVAPGIRRALDADERSAHEPNVVGELPSAGRRRTPVSTDPRHARLPRP